MQSFFEKRNIALDTSQPSIRHLQDLIRHKTPVAVQVLGVGEIEGMDVVMKELIVVVNIRCPKVE